MPATEAENRKKVQAVFDQQDVADALVCGRADKAERLCESKIKWLQERGLLDEAAACAFLTALNVCLYQNVRRTFSGECLDCCANCGELGPKNGVITAAKAMIRAYKSEIDAINGENQTVDRACAFIQEHLSGDLSLEVIAAQVFTGKCYLCELFRKHKQCTIGDYVHAQRIGLATRLLRTTKLRIGDIAESCGFSSTAYFSNVYRRATGHSPSECREINC